MTEEELKTNKAALELLLSENTDKRTDYEAQIAQIGVFEPDREQKAEQGAG